MANVKHIIIVKLSKLWSVQWHVMVKPFQLQFYAQMSNIAMHVTEVTLHKAIYLTSYNAIMYHMYV